MSLILPGLPTGEVHVWRAGLELPAARLAELERVLAPGELDRAGRLRSDMDRARYVAGRGLLRRLLGGYAAIPPQRIRFRYGPTGKPELPEEMNPGELHFNVSHSGDLALFAFARGRRVGVDMERLRAVRHAGRIAERVFPPGELESWRALPPDQRTSGFIARWTRLEAVAKLHGGGVWWLVAQTGRALRGVAVHDTTAPAGHLAAVAVEGELVELREMELEA